MYITLKGFHLKLHINKKYNLIVEICILLSVKVAPYKMTCSNNDK